jgi:hypothetical protein
VNSGLLVGEGRSQSAGREGGVLELRALQGGERLLAFDSQTTHAIRELL